VVGCRRAGMAAQLGLNATWPSFSRDRLIRFLRGLCRPLLATKYMLRLQPLAEPPAFKIPSDAARP